MTTEKAFFDELKNFGAEVLHAREQIELEKRAKEKQYWETVIKDLFANMKGAEARGCDNFSVFVDTLTDEQRKELIKKITENDKRLTAVVRHRTLRDSSEADILEVKINFTTEK